MPSFFVPTPRYLDSLCVPTPGNLPTFFKKMLMPGVSPGGWALLELTDALQDKKVKSGCLPRGRFMHTGRITAGNSESRVHNFPENQILMFLWRIGNQEKARTVTDRFASSVVPSCRYLVRGKILESIRADPKEFPNFRKKGQPQEVDRNKKFLEPVFYIRL